MTRPHYTFRTLPPEYRDVRLWKHVDTSALSEDERARFDHLKIGIETYIKTGNLSAASKEAGYTGPFLIKQLNRCTTMAEDGLIWGWAGLLKGARLNTYERKAPLPVAVRGTGKGFSGCFSRFLSDHDDIRTELDALILKMGRKKAEQEARITIKKLTLKLRDLCRDHGIREDEYPLNSVSMARRSVGRYVKWLIQNNISKGTRARFGRAAEKHLSVGTGTSGVPTYWAPFDACGLDAHEIHCFGCVVIPGPAGPQRVAIERLWFIPVVDAKSRAILGYSVGIRTEASSATIEESLISATSKWQPRTLSISGLKYREGSGLPSGVMPILIGCFPSILIIDNAAQHYAKRIAERARRRLGCAVTFGSVGHWEHNAIVERLFKTLETYGFQRLPSTTGSNPNDPVKNKPIENALKLGITWEALLDLTDVLVAEYNSSSNRGIGGQTPLQVLANYIESADSLFLPRHLPPPTVDQPELGVTVETRFVRGSQQNGRRPYVEIDHVHYTCPVLAHSFGLVGQKIRVHIREANICVVRAYFDDGQELGMLKALGSWSKTPHTREMRKQIWAAIDAGEMVLPPGEDPVEIFLQMLAARASQDAREHPNSISRSGTKLANAANVSGLPIPPVTSPPPADTPLADGRVLSGPIPTSVKSPVWKSVT